MRRLNLLHSRDDNVSANVMSMMLAKTSSISQKTRLGRKYKLSGFLATTKQFELSNASGVYFTALWAIAEYFFRRRVNFQDLLKREKKYSETSLKKKLNYTNCIMEHLFSTTIDYTAFISLVDRKRYYDRSE